MEISGKVLREVEFRDRLRGYDTDEVDEFLEKVAVGVDEMRSELVALREQVTQVGKRVEEPTPAIDDDSIRRTLVLAQRTADLAISEAKEEATRLLDEARAQAEGALNQANDAARRLKEEAEFEVHERIDRLSEQRDRLERDIQSLAHLLGSERDRLTQALQSALGFVTESLSLSDEMSRAASAVSNKGQKEPVDEQPLARPEPAARPLRSAPLPDVEAEISEDAATALGDDIPIPSARRPGDFTTSMPSAESELDPDEALWARWAQGVDVDLNATAEHGEQTEARQYRFPRGGQGA